MRRTRNRVWPVLMAAVCAAFITVVSGCGSQNGSTDEAPGRGSGRQTVEGAKKLSLMYHFKSHTMDPANDTVAVKAGVAETLVKLDNNLTVQPWLATKWEAVDNTTWVFTIRDGVTFHDGTPLDAAAVKASLERAFRVNESVKHSLNIDSIEAIGQELTIVTNGPNPALPSDLINPYTAIVQVQAEEEMIKTAPVATGPFTVEQFSPGTGLKLVRYDGYWDGPAKLSEVDFKFNEDGNVRTMALQSGEVDIATQLPAETVSVIEQHDDLFVDSIPSLRVHFLLFNPAREATQQLKVRQALDLLIDREGIANDAMFGHAEPANGPFNTQLPFGSSDDVKKPDVEAAKQLLIEAGYEWKAGKMMKDGEPMTLKLITYRGRPELPVIAQVFQSEAQKAGVSVQIQTVENVDTTIREHTDWDIVTYSNLSAPRGDGGYFFNSALMPGGALNAANIEIDGLVEIVEQLNLNSDFDTRIQLTKEAMMLVNEYVPHAYIVYPHVITGIHQRVTNWRPSAVDYYVIDHQMDVN